MPESAQREPGAMRFIFAKAVAAFLVLPGMIGFAVPLSLSPPHSGTHPVHWAGVPVIAIGLVILLWCVRDFYVAGKGTLAPWSPPKNLVRVGLYRYSRNPMYVGVATILTGWALWFMSVTLLIYAIAVMVAFHLRVTLGEEPWLARTHGQTWVDYRKQVPRWFSRERLIHIFH